MPKTDLDACIDFLQRLIQTPSLPGEESAIVQLVRSEMESLGYDEVSQDEAGNVTGTLGGEGKAPPVLFNTHLDHVDVGDHSRWPHPPFGAEVHQRRVWGRGAVDIKGPLAAQVYGVAGLIGPCRRPPGDVLVTAVVQEEVGGTGARYMVGQLEPSIAVIGEPSSNTLRRGHRGRTQLELHVTGRSVHASVPWRGVNPLQVVSRFITALQELEMRQDPSLGSSSVAPTLIRTDQSSPNVIPAEVWLTCDWRNIPGESGEDCRRALQELADCCLIKGAEAEVSVPVFQRRSFTGYQAGIPADNPAFLTSDSHPAVQAAQGILEDSIGLSEPVGVWQFATDGGHFHRSGWTVIGFGPGDEALAHTVIESVEISEIEQAMLGNQALALELGQRAARG